MKDNKMHLKQALSNKHAKLKYNWITKVRIIKVKKNAS